jgi:hypothetical protein
MKSTEISYSEDEDFEENDSYDMTLDELLEHLSIPLGGSPLVIGPTIANSAMPMSQNQFPETESADNNISRTWTGILSFYG